jgi:hypothetical protein
MGGSEHSFFINLTKDMKKLGNEMQSIKEQDYEDIYFSKFGYNSIAIGPKLRKLKKWSKQTEYGGEI